MLIITDMGVEAVDKSGINFPSFKKEEHLFRLLLCKIKILKETIRLKVNQGFRIYFNG